MTQPLGPSLFTPPEGRGILDQLTTFADSAITILGTLIVGTGSEGFRDEYSDIDVVFVGEPDHFAAVVKATRQFVESRLRPVFLTTYQHRDDVIVLCLLLENYLEVDIGVWSSATLFASSPKWTLVQSRDRRAGESIIECMANHPQLQRLHPPIVTGDDPTWQSVYAEFIASRRASGTAADQRTHATDAKLQPSEPGVPGTQDTLLVSTSSEKQMQFLKSLVPTHSR